MTNTNQSPAGDVEAREAAVDQEWQYLCEKDDRTSPAEYPHMVLISRDELGEAISQGINAYLAKLTPTKAGPSRIAEIRALEWRCFHCDDVFSTKEDARAHFGDTILDDAACKLNAAEHGLVKVIREMQAELRAYRQEENESYKEFYRLGADHSQALMREEEKGYARGLRDGRAESVNSHDTLKSELTAIEADRDRMRAALEKIKLLHGGAFALEQAKEIARAALTPTNPDREG